MCGADRIMVFWFDRGTGLCRCVIWGEGEEAGWVELKAGQLDTLKGVIGGV
jgi:hypothetical protein